MPGTVAIAALVLGSGLCALIYQTVWMRELRLIFGVSTAASAAVLAIFMGGLGVGSLVLGRRVERASNSLRYYANLELGIAISTALSPTLLLVVQNAYVSAGGTATLGAASGTALRMVLASLVLGVPTFLMGGTLPAIVRVVERTADRARRSVGILYAVNTTGAVVGVFLATFALIEIFGVRLTLYVGTLINLLIAIVARSWSRRVPAEQAEVDSDSPAVAEESTDGSRLLPVFVAIAAAVVGFAFFAMELVWYRMLAPLLAGSSYSFGLILTVALFGIGVGGFVYGLGRGARRPTVLALAGTCVLEALLLALPFAVGDDVAVLALSLQSLGAFGFWGFVTSWSVITALVVLPPAIVAGYQFPLLVGLLGSGRKNVGREVGFAYMANTLGAIVGSVAAGFGLMVVLSAPGLWVVVVVLLVVQAAAAVLVARTMGESLRPAIPVTALGLLALVGIAGEGPTAGWRHSPIGVGRVPFEKRGPNEITDLLHRYRRRVLWDADGIESTVALAGLDSYSFIVSGKIDGNALLDAPMAVMAPLLGAILHPQPKRGLVIGLGNGGSAGWLAEVEGMESVDVVELEPVILDVAQASAPMNHDVLNHPKVNVIIGDAREFLLTTDRRYDVILSEPSNPYRAGIASLFSQDFYHHVAEHLTEHGVLVQWLQAYEIDGRTSRTVFATLASVFPEVETWSVQVGDLVLVSRLEPTPHDVGEIARRVQIEPFRSALDKTWGVQGVEGFYTGYLATGELAKAILERDRDWIDTDDQPILEFGFARSLGGTTHFDVSMVRAVATRLGIDHPTTTGGTIDWTAVAEARLAREIALDARKLTVASPSDDPSVQHRMAARQAFAQQRWRQVVERWFSQEQEPVHHADLRILAAALARTGDSRVPEYAERLRRFSEVEAELVLADYHASAGLHDEARDHLLRGFELARTDPWPSGLMLRRSLTLASSLAQRDPELGRGIYQTLADPFAIRLLEDARYWARLNLAKRVDFAGLCVEALAPFEPHIPWRIPFLHERHRCYELTGHPLAATATDQLERAHAAGGFPFETGLLDGDVDTPILMPSVDEARSR